MPSSHESSSSNISIDETDGLEAEYPRKRRRVSEPVSRDENFDRHQSTLPAASRIRPRRKDAPSISLVQDELHLPNGKVVDAKSSFATIDVAPWLIASLAAMAIQRPTAIQKGCIPQILGGKDVIGGSQTGSGKTIAFAVPVLQKWAEDPMGVYAVILTPTRLILSYIPTPES